MKTLNKYVSEALIKKDTKLKTNYQTIILNDIEYKIDFKDYKGYKECNINNIYHLTDYIDATEKFVNKLYNNLSTLNDRLQRCYEDTLYLWYSLCEENQSYIDNKTKDYLSKLKKLGWEKFKANIQIGWYYFIAWLSKNLYINESLITKNTKIRTDSTIVYLIYNPTIEKYKIYLSLNELIQEISKNEDKYIIDKSDPKFNRIAYQQGKYKYIKEIKDTLEIIQNKCKNNEHINDNDMNKLKVLSSYYNDGYVKTIIYKDYN